MLRFLVVVALRWAEAVVGGFVALAIRAAIAEAILPGFAALFIVLRLMVVIVVAMSPRPIGGCAQSRRAEDYCKRQSCCTFHHKLTLQGAERYQVALNVALA